MLYAIQSTGNKTVTTQFVTTQCLTEEEIQKLKDSLDPSTWQDAKMYRSGHTEEQFAKINKDYRKNKMQHLFPSQQDGFPFPKISHIISKMNDEFYKFDLRYINFMEDCPSVLKYTEGGKFNWHLDVGPNYATRKISYTIQLSDTDDYEGGDLEFFNGEEKRKDPNLRKRGNIIMFPAYTWHRVTPVTKGTRYALVGWIHGPTFR